MALECTGAESFWCALDSMGGMLGGFLQSFGGPAASFLFIILMVGFIAITFVAVTRVIGRR